ncbi:hypothetical protein [Streptomyces sp. NPDC002845]
MVSRLIAAVVSLAVAMVSVFSGIVVHDPLREMATDAPAGSDANHWWPLLVYGPWAVASLSIQRAALHQHRRATHSWGVVLFLLRRGHGAVRHPGAEDTPGISAAAIPAISALTCFQRRCVTLTRAPRKATSRHRNASPSSKWAFRA